MNILLVSSKYMPEYSGSGFRAHNLYKRLTKKHPEIEITVLAGSETENESTVYDHDGFTVTRIAEKPFPSLGSGIYRRYQIAKNFHSEYNATRKYLKSLSVKPDLIHIFGQNYVSASVLRFAGENNIPVLIELCNEMDMPHHFIPVPYKFWISGKPGSQYSFVCISERLKNVCLRQEIPENSIWCRPNPINEHLFKEVQTDEKIEIRKHLTKFDSSSKLLVYIAKYITRKNHIFLLDVIKCLPEEYRLFLGGPLVESGPNKEQNTELVDKINSRIEKEGLDEKVQVESGFCKNIENYYQMADVYLFPTKAEGLGTPMLESVACGIPVVANIIPGITDSWIKDGENGYLSNLDPETYAKKIMQAVEIGHQQMVQESEKIIETAGTEIIDNKYYELIQGLTES